LGNTIVAGNTSLPSSGKDIEGAIMSLGHNLIGNSAGASGFVAGDLVGTAAHPLDPLLSPLGDHGATTQTLALLPGSPAIDAGDNSLIPAGVTTDQRGLPRVVNGTVDIGAFESGGFTISYVSGGGQSTAVNTAFALPLVVQVTAKNAHEPVANGVVTYHGPNSGASISPNPSRATIAAGGQASLSATANGSAGSYTVRAFANGASNTPGTLIAVLFGLTNKAGSIHSPAARAAGTAGAGSPAAVLAGGPSGGPAPAQDAQGGGAAGPWLSGDTTLPSEATASGSTGLGVQPLTDLALRPSGFPAMPGTDLADPAAPADLSHLTLL
jgi:hypothetical protein